MHKVLASSALFTLVVLTVAGCANFEAVATTEISQDCGSAIQNQNKSWSDTDTSENDLQAAELVSLQSCKDLDEWSSAVSYNPGAMGYTVLRTEEAANSVYLACQSIDNENLTPVCADAAGRGYLD